MIIWAVVRSEVIDGKVTDRQNEFVDVGVTEQDADIIIENAVGNEEHDKVMNGVQGEYVYHKRIVLLKDFFNKEGDLK
jgi:hypothetical protein